MTPDLIELHPGRHEVEVRPRWPARAVRIDRTAWARVVEAQARLPDGVRLRVTRAYEPERLAHAFARRIGRLLFGLVFPWRRREAAAIFHHNGHAKDGAHVDIAVVVGGRALRLLPLGVFTPSFLVARAELQHREVLAAVRAALREAGFVPHPNATEALQIHCDLRGAAD